MKKKVIIGLCTFLTIILLFPIPLHLKDGGTVEYKAVLYSVQRVHKLGSVDSAQEYLEGTVVKVLGFEVFNNVK